LFSILGIATKDALNMDTFIKNGSYIELKDKDGAVVPFDSYSKYSEAGSQGIILFEQFKVVKSILFKGHGGKLWCPAKDALFDGRKMLSFISFFFFVLLERKPD